MHRNLTRLLGIVSLLALAGCSGSGGTAPAVRIDLEAKGNTIRNLYDAFGTEYDGAAFDFGFSALIEYNGRTILFDAGTNADIFRGNVEAHGIDLGSVDLAVASHSHADHISGFDYLLEVNPRVKLYLPKDFHGLGAPVDFPVGDPDDEAISGLPPDLNYFNGRADRVISITPSGRFWNADVDYVSEHMEVAEGVTLIVTRSPYMGTFSRYPGPGDSSAAEPSLTGLPELTLALETPDGHALVVGCSHSTVDGITAAAKKHLGGEVALVMGGFHLLPYGADELSALGARLIGELGVKRVAPSHCTGPLAIHTLRNLYGANFTAAGLGAEIPF